MRKNPGERRRLKAAVYPADTFMRWSVPTRTRGNGGSGKRQGKGTSLPCVITLWNAVTLTKGSILLREAAYEGYAPAMYHYALECDDPCVRMRWLKRAAEAGHGPAMYQFGLECEDPVERKRWRLQAVMDGYGAATNR